MASATIPGVYAAALLAVARERGTTEAVIASCRKLIDALSAEVLRPLDNPLVGKTLAKQTVGGVVANEPKEIYDLLQLLVDRNRLESAAEILGETIRQFEAEEGIIHVKVKVAVAMTDAFRTPFDARIKDRQGQGAQLDISVDASLIGGYTARIGDNYVDASIKRQLVEMRQAMLTTPVTDHLWAADV
jgi:F-type H+-transporting ATPase subunit delta